MVFRLLCLPDNVVIFTLRTMDIPVIFCFSLISKATKHLVIDLKLKCLDTCLLVSTQVHLLVRFGKRNRVESGFKLNHFTMDGNDGQKDLGMSTHVGYEYGEVDREYFLEEESDSGVWLGLEYSVRDWILHIDSLFHRKLEWIAFLEGSQIYRPKSIREGVEGLHFATVDVSHCDRPEEVFETFHDAPKILLSNRHAPGSQTIQKMMISNFDKIALKGVRSMSLDMLLLCNSRTILLENSILTPKDLNRFLRSWCEGSMLRLGCLTCEIHSLNDFVEEEILKGLKRGFLEKNQERMNIGVVDRSVVVQGKGREAMLEFSHFLEYSSISFEVCQ